MARRSSSKQRKAERALRDLLVGLGCELKGELRQTPRRAAELWTRYLLDGEGQDFATILGRGSATRSRAPVTLYNVGVHLVCPHHLTVAFGLAHVGYLPDGRAAGFGALARLIHASTARLVLQEDASANIAETIVERIGASAAVAIIDAMHPCHNVPHARSHRARAVTWAEAGNTAGVRQLKALLKNGMRCHAR